MTASEIVDLFNSLRNGGLAREEALEVVIAKIHADGAVAVAKVPFTFDHSKPMPA